MNLKWKKKQRPPASVPEVIRCTGAELVLVLAKLRRCGRTASEPVHDGPDSWLVYPGGGGGDGAFKPDPFGQQDHAYTFNTFDQGSHGSMKLEY